MSVNYAVRQTDLDVLTRIILLYSSVDTDTVACVYTVHLHVYVRRAMWTAVCVYIWFGVVKTQINRSSPSPLI